MKRSRLTEQQIAFALPHSRSGPSSCLHDLDGCYAQFVNRKYALSGHLWQDRFFGCVLDSTHLCNALRYVEQNPVRAGLVKTAEEYRWSSAAAHCGLRADRVLTPGFPPPGLIADWSQWLKLEVEARHLQGLLETAHRGLPCGSETFLCQLEEMLGTRLRPRRPGRRPGATRRSRKTPRRNWCQTRTRITNWQQLASQFGACPQFPEVQLFVMRKPYRMRAHCSNRCTINHLDEIVRSVLSGSESGKRVYLETR